MMSTPSLKSISAPLLTVSRHSTRNGHIRRTNVLHTRVRLSNNQLRRNPSSRLRCSNVEPLFEETYDSITDDRIPVTVISGFLGSGKTTLLNNILTKDHGRRIAVIENEFGEIDIDSELVTQKERLDGTDDIIMMLNNGCLCCTVREDLITSLNALYERRAEFDHIIIETTGMANVSPIISTFYLANGIPERIRLDGVVTVVDAKHVERHMRQKSDGNETSEAVDQIAYADRIILNKIDLVDEPALTHLEERVRKINDMATMTKTSYAAVSVDYVLGIGGFDVSRVDEQLLPPEEKQTRSNDHDHHHEHDHKHEDGVTSISITIEEDLDLESINTVVSAIVDYRGEDIFRMKGILAIDGWKQRFVFQGVHMLFEGVPDRLWRENEKRISKMVFIGRDLNYDDFADALDACRASKAKILK